MTIPWRVLVLGADGLFGSAFVAVAGADSRVSAVIAAGRARADVTRPADVARLLQDARPDIVVNAAAIAGADRCEEDPRLAYDVNAGGARSVARACAEVGAVCVYLSTDVVFDGTKSVPYDEADNPRPILTCGISKLAGELETLRAGPRNLVVRTSALFGPHPCSPNARRGFVDRIMDRAAAGERARVVDSVVISPTYTVDLSRMLLELLAEDVGGTFHLVNTGAASWFELADATVAEAGLAAAPVASESAGEYAVAPRPAATPLTSARLPENVRKVNRPWRAALATHLAGRTTPGVAVTTAPRC